MLGHNCKNMDNQRKNANETTQVSQPPLLQSELSLKEADDVTVMCSPKSQLTKIENYVTLPIATMTFIQHTHDNNSPQPNYNFN